MKNNFAVEELEVINQCAYFDYQRDKIYFRDKKMYKRREARRATTVYLKDHPFNKEIEVDVPRICPKCSASNVFKHMKLYKTVFDLKFFNHGIKRWVVRYTSGSMKCQCCKSVFSSSEFKEISGKYGHCLKAWVVYQIIAARQSYSKVQGDLRKIFNYNFGDGILVRMKSDLVEYYSETYKDILSRLKSGKLLHVDETTISVKGIKGYVWVFTSMEDVIYAYSPNRDGDLLRETLSGFNGVLVSDFYSVYESVDCVQQRCLIHLIRDMNDDLLKNAFDKQYKDFVSCFAGLLKSIIETIDKHGLRKQYLTKHKEDVGKFFAEFVLVDSTSEVTSRYQKRFRNNQTKLFTFLDYDDVPWNNNNAEHAVKGFVAHRKMIDGFFEEEGLKKHLGRICKQWRIPCWNAQYEPSRFNQQTVGAPQAVAPTAEAVDGSAEPAASARCQRHRVDLAYWRALGRSAQALW
jgi:hypothetical protein